MLWTKQCFGATWAALHRKLGGVLPGARGLQRRKPLEEVFLLVD